jgi:transmembrane sensor
MTDRNDRDGDETARDAADWFARLNSDAATAQDWTAFEAWLTASPSHEPAFRAVESLWLDLEARGVDAPSAQILPFRRRSGMDKSAPRRGDREPVFGRLSRKVWAGLAVAGLAVVTLVVAGALPRVSGGPAQTVLTVPVGQTRTLALRGGSATVAGGTRLELAESADGQRISLQGGLATFHLKHDPSRRLTVLAAGQRITDIGTVFTTQLVGAALLVSVGEGEVEVQPAAGSGQAIRVRAGQALVRRSGEASSRVLGADLTALRRPYQDTPLAEVVADLNQFYSRPIAITDTNTARLRFTGVLVLDSEEAVVRRLEAYLPVQARFTADRVVLAQR